MPKLPFLKFYPSDWRSDERVAMCGLAARGLWLEMLLIMHNAVPYGHLLVDGKAPTDTQLASLARTQADQIPGLLDELERFGVFSRTRSDVIYSRRLTRDEKKRADGKTAAKTGAKVPGSRRSQRVGKDKEKLPPPGVVAGVASQPPASLEARGLDLREDKSSLSARALEAEFQRWYAAFPLHKAPDAARKAFARARRKASLEELIAGAERYAAECRAKATEKRYRAHPATWLNDGRWADEPDLPLAPATPGGDGQRRARIRSYQRDGEWLSQWGPPPQPAELLEGAAA